MQTLRRLVDVLPTTAALVALLFILAIMATPGVLDFTGASAEAAANRTLVSSDDDPAAQEVSAVRPADAPIQLAQATFVRQDVYDDSIEIRPQAVNRSDCRNGCVAGPGTVTNHRVKERYWSRAPSAVGREALRNGGDVTVIAVPVIR